MQSHSAFSHSETTKGHMLSEKLLVSVRCYRCT